MSHPPASSGFLLQPLAGWPRSVVPGRPYLVTLDLQVSEDSGEWPYDEEELTYPCMLDGTPYFTVDAVDDGSVILHRFGGTYGPARFVITAGEVLGEHRLALNITSEGGILLHSAELPVTVTDSVEAAESLSRLPAKAVLPRQEADSPGEGAPGSGSGSDEDQAALFFAAASNSDRSPWNRADVAGYAGPHLLAVAEQPDVQPWRQAPSKLVIEALRVLDRPHGPEELSDAFSAGADRIQAEASLESSPMGASFTAMLWRGRDCVLFHVGKTRGYMLRDGELFQMTQDEPATALDEGLLEREIRVRRARFGDRYLLCTAGLPSAVHIQEIYDALAEEATPERAARRLLALAERAGERTGIACVVADVKPAGEVGQREPVVIGTPEEATDDERTEDFGVSIPGYAILGRLGEGGASVVYRARDLFQGKGEVAIKVLRTGAGDLDAESGRFHRGVEAMDRFDSDRLVRVYEIGRSDRPPAAPYLVMELVPGLDLWELVEREGPLHGDRLWRLAIGLVEAMAVLHRGGTVHRDIKPGSVRFRGEEPVLGNFDIARGLHSSRFTDENVVVGTVEYLSPEVIEGGDHLAPADVHAAGATLVFAATGRSPFKADSVIDTLSRIVRDPPDLEGVPEDLLPFVQAMLRRDPRERPTAEALLRDLTGAYASSDVPRVAPRERDLVAICEFCGAARHDGDAALPRCPSCGNQGSGGPPLVLFFEEVEIRLPAGTSLLLGREETSPVWNHFQEEEVSRRHATVWCDLEGRAWVRDEDSTNGTYVNGTPVSSTPRRLHDGDSLWLGREKSAVIGLTAPREENRW